MALERLRVLERLRLAEEKKRGVFVLNSDWQEKLFGLQGRLSSLHLTAIPLEAPPNGYTLLHNGIT